MPGRVAARVVDERGRELDQALEQLPLGEVARCPSTPARAARGRGRSRPGRRPRGRARAARAPVAPPGIGRYAFARRPGRMRSRRLGVGQRMPPGSGGTGRARSRRTADARELVEAGAGRRSPRRAACQCATSPSPRRQHSQIGRPLTSAGKSISPVEMSRSVMSISTSRATPACIWSMRPCMPRRRSRICSAAPAVGVSPSARRQRPRPGRAAR